MIIVFIAVLYWLVVVIPKGHFHDNFMISTSGVGE